MQKCRMQTLLHVEIGRILSGGRKLVILQISRKQRRGFQDVKAVNIVKKYIQTVEKNIIGSAAIKEEEN